MWICENCYPFQRLVALNYSLKQKNQLSLTVVLTIMNEKVGWYLT